MSKAVAAADSVGGAFHTMKVADLLGGALDWAVALALGALLENKREVFRRMGKGVWTDEKMAEQLRKMTNEPVMIDRLTGNFEPVPTFSSSRDHGGRILEEAGIATRKHSGSGLWYAMLSSDLGDGEAASWDEATYKGRRRYGILSYEVQPRRQRFSGETLLIAAMRCYVASKLGEEIEVPALLLAA